MIARVLGRSRAAFGDHLSGHLLVMGAATVVGRGLTFGTVAYTARVVGRHSFGLLGYGVAIAAYAAILVGPGLLVWGTRAIARDRARAGTLLVVINAVQLTLACVSYGALLVVAWRLFAPDQRGVVAAAGISLFAVAVSVEWVAQGLERFRLVALGQVVAAITALVLTVALIHGPTDVWRAPLATAAGQMLGACLVVASLLRAGHLRHPRLDVPGGLAILRASLPLGLSVAMVTVLHYANNIYLGASRGPAELGTFVAGYRVLEVLAFVPGVVTAVFLPRLSRLHGEDRSQWRASMHTYVAIAMTLAVLPAAIVAIESPALVSVVYGPDYSATAPVLAVMSFGIVFNFAAIAYINGLLTIGRDRAYIASIGAAMVVSVLAGALLVPRFGLWAATGVVSSLDFVTWCVTLPYYRSSGAPLFLLAWVRPLAAGAVSAAVLLGLGALGVGLLARLVAGVLAYGLVALPLRRTLGLLGRA